VLQIEPGRHLTFEWVSPLDVLNEYGGKPPVRGANCTSVDAAFLHRRTDGVQELVLVEWKYTESYRPRAANPAKDLVRRRRYEALYHDADGPIDAAVLELTDAFDEPIYQLVRQQLLAHALERHDDFEPESVRVLHISDPANDRYLRSLSAPALRRLGDDVWAVWTRLLRHPDRFLRLSSAHFLNPDITSHEYVARYGAEVIRDAADLGDQIARRVGVHAIPDATQLGAELEDLLEFDGDVWVADGMVEFKLGSASLGVPFPCTWQELAVLGELVEQEADLDESA
jgi:hypothetical protein